MMMELPERPVEGFDLKFKWNQGRWEQIFDKQTELIRQDIRRARLGGKIIAYLSCPLSARGGGHAGTNVEIAQFTERRLLREWGEQFWILNPAQYQLESQEGAGLLDLHAKELNIDLPKLLRDEPIGGGDYMRMWTKILVEDIMAPTQVAAPANPLKNTGSAFEAFYFLGPSDMQAFFGAERSSSRGTAIEEYFGRKYAVDRSFRDSFSVPGLDGFPLVPGAPTSTPEALAASWQSARRAFVVFYALRAGVTFSLGSHDVESTASRARRSRRRDPQPDSRFFRRQGNSDVRWRDNQLLGLRSLVGANRGNLSIAIGLLVGVGKDR
jgi:hypothetical protein